MHCGRSWTAERSGTAALLVLVLAATAGAARPAVAAPAAAPQAAPGSRTVTLITGDRVRVFTGPDGEMGVGLQPAPGREHIGFLRDTRTGDRGTDLSVVPADAAPLLAAGRLDPRLFDVTELLRQGLTDSVPTLPLIVRYAAAPVAPAGATATVPLPSVHGAAVRQDKRRGDGFWRWLTSEHSGRGIAKVWLDAVARPTLDVSVPQIGAPTAWQAGFTGAGVTVGLLDTGVKADHPDLAGKVVEARDFTGTRPDAGDDVGHGTHVAGVIAGTGAASGGRYRGVAPDAKLVNGKVCVDYGCPESAVIAGMEWIAPKVRVVNLSLSAGSSDGTDPLSQAVNNLSAAYGTLFVAAAGNGDPVETIAAPAAADAALAVASVDDQDATSPFSSRGPRQGDYAVKPDIAAPGSGIVSARAPGTPAGDAEPVDDNYTSLSGTSIAAPHVAGAAALLAQQHPEWTADRLKSTLTSTAKATGGVFEQGAGRVDAGRAVTQPVSALGGSLNFGFLAWPHRQAAAPKTVTYRNDGDAAVTLALSLVADGPDGQRAPAGLFTASAGQVTVPAHGTAGVGVTVGPAAGVAGLYGGRLTATADGITVQTALAAYVEPESYNLTVRLISRTGQFNGGVGQVVNTETGDVFGIRPFNTDGTAVVRLPRGNYDVNAFDLSGDAVTLMSWPGLALGADATVTLDATAGRPITTTVDRPDAERQFGEVGLLSATPAGDRGGSLSWFALPQYQIFAVPTAATVTDHTYAFYLRAALGGTAFVYNLAFLERGRIPANTNFQAHNRDLATVDARYYTQGASGEGLRADYARLAVPGTGVGPGVIEVYRQALPSRRTEYYTASPDVTWQEILGVGPADESDVEISWSIRSYRPGRYRADWNRAPLGPAFGYPGDGWGVFRAGDLLQVAVCPLSGNDPAQFTSPPYAMTGTTTLSRDGVELGASPLPGLGAFPIPDTPGTYLLRSTAVRVVPWSVVGTSADVTWTFHEPGAAAPAAPLPLLVVRASGDVDERGRAPAGRPYLLSLAVQRQPGAPAGRLTALRVEASFDDGGTWTPAPATVTRDGGYAVLRHPSGDGFVSLRITARDAQGNAVTQTVLRAYQTVQSR